VRQQWWHKLTRCAGGRAVADLSGVFNWSVKQLFMWVSIEYFDPDCGDRKAGGCAQEVSDGAAMLHVCAVSDTSHADAHRMHTDMRHHHRRLRTLAIPPSLPPPPFPHPLCSCGSLACHRRWVVAAAVF
jgi:hypothetical protein